MTVVKNSREIALHVLMDVETKKAYANLALNRLLGEDGTGKLDRALTTELVYGALRALNTLDWALDQHLRKPIAGLPVPVRNILRLGAYQILFMDRIPASAAVNEAVKLTRRYGHAGTAGLVNGVLRNLARGGVELRYPDSAAEPVAYLALRYSHPRWLVRRWLAELGFAAAEALLSCNNRPAPNTVRVNTLKTDPATLQSLLRRQGIEAVAGQYAAYCLHLSGFSSLGEVPQFKAGLFQPQDESSIMVGQALSPSPGALVVDLAAAPGGKATHLAQLMQNKGEIIACDVHEHKIKLIADNCRRLGVEIVRPMVADARKVPVLYPQLQADYLLVDAPCSGLGVLRRRPDARWRKEEAQIKELAVLQGQMLEAAHRLLKPGGVLVYSTCTMTAEENLGQVEAFLTKFPVYEPESLAGLLSEALDCQHTMAKGYLQIWPHIYNGPDGFFMARLRKK